MAFGFKLRKLRESEGHKTMEFVLTAKPKSFASDKNPIEGNLTYYAIVKETIQLNCHGHECTTIKLW